MADKKEDRRIRSIRDMLHDALLELMVEKGYQAITVQDIIDRANVGRSTFYCHFVDKEQLLLGNLDRLREFLKVQSGNHSLSASPNEYRFGFSLAMLQHAQGNKQLYKAMVNKKGGAIVMQHMQNMLATLIRDEIAKILPHSGSLKIPPDIIVAFVVNTFLTLLTWWMAENTPCLATEVDRTFHKLALSGLNSLQVNQ